MQLIVLLDGSICLMAPGCLMLGKREQKIEICSFTILRGMYYITWRGYL